MRFGECMKSMNFAAVSGSFALAGIPKPCVSTIGYGAILPLPNFGSVMKPAGFENSQGILSAAYAKDGADPQWDNDPGMKKVFAFLEKYYPDANKSDSSVVYGYGAAQTLVKVLQMCGDDLTRANVMKQAASLKDFAPDTLLPDITINTSPTDYAPIE